MKKDDREPTEKGSIKTAGMRVCYKHKDIIAELILL